MADNKKGSKLQQVVAENLALDEGECTANAHLVDDLGADSLDVIEVVMAVEEAFDIEISDDEGAELKTFGDLEELVTKKTAKL